MTQFAFSFAFLSICVALFGAVTLVWRHVAAPRAGFPGAAIIAGSAVVFAALFPYWLFGTYSAIGWYDEYNATIPYSIMAALRPVADFDHTMAGGAAIESLHYSTNDAFSLYEMLIRALGPQVASLVFRFMGLLFTLCGGYATAKLIFRQGSAASFISACIVVFGTVYAYAWTLGGFGWTIAVVIWLGVVLFGPLNGVLRVMCAGLLGVIAVMTCHPFFLLAWSPIYVLLLWALFPVSIARLIRQCAVAGLVFAAIALAGSWQTLMAFSEQLTESARYMGVDGLASFQALLDPARAPSLGGSVLASLENFKLFTLSGLQFLLTGNVGTLAGYPLTVVFFGVAVAFAIWLGWFRKEWRMALAGGGAFAAIFALSVLSDVVEIPLVSNFRWDTAYNVVWPIVGVLCGSAFHEIGSSARPLLKGVSGVLLGATLLVSAASMAQRSLGTIHAYGGWPVLASYPVLREFATSHPLARAGSIPTGAPKEIVAPFHGLAAIDGVRPSFTWRRTAFWYLTMRQSPPANWNPTVQTLGTSAGDVNAVALRMLNVEFALSTDPDLHLPGYSTVASQQAMKLSDTSVVGHEILSVLLPGFVVLPPLYVYATEGAWRRLFVPSQLISSSSSEKASDYYSQLRDIPRHSVLVPADAPNWLHSTPGGVTGPAIISAAPTSTGMDIVTDGQPGLLVYNQEFSMRWSANCDDRVLPIAPINGMMMIIDVPAGCTTLSFLFESG